MFIIVYYNIKQFNMLIFVLKNKCNLKMRSMSYKDYVFQYVPYKFAQKCHNMKYNVITYMFSHV